jgi:uncharacterized protein YdiU (UPF0061 family)
MQLAGVDYTWFFRLLSSTTLESFEVKKGNIEDRLLQKLLEAESEKQLASASVGSSHDVQDDAQCDIAKMWKSWFTKYKRRVQNDFMTCKSSLTVSMVISNTEEYDRFRVKNMKDMNPNFVMRNWMINEAMRLLEKEEKKGADFLNKLFKCLGENACKDIPYGEDELKEPWWEALAKPPPPVS